MKEESKRFIAGIFIAAIIGFGAGYAKGYLAGYIHPDHFDFVNDVLEVSGKTQEVLASRLIACEGSK